MWWESGARPGETPGAPYSTGTQGFASWPVPSTPTTWYLSADGALSTAAPALADGEPRAVDAYVSDPEVRPRRNYDGASDDLWHAEPDFEWTPMVDGNALTYLSEPLDEPLSIVGPSSLDLWLRSTATDTDVQVTLTEVYPDGGERYVQSGWLRASHRELEAGRTTALSPIPTHLEADNEPLVPGELTELRVGIFPVAHTFHSGSQLRISISAPGGDRPALELRHPQRRRGQRGPALRRPPVAPGPAGGGRRPDRRRRPGLPEPAQPALPRLRRSQRGDRRRGRRHRRGRGAGLAGTRCPTPPTSWATRCWARATSRSPPSAPTPWWSAPPTPTRSSWRSAACPSASTPSPSARSSSRVRASSRRHPSWSPWPPRPRRPRPPSPPPRRRRRRRTPRTTTPSDPGEVDDDALPRTGSDPTAPIAWAVALIAVGAVLAANHRRTRRTT